MKCLLTTLAMLVLLPTGPALIHSAPAPLHRPSSPNARSIPVKSGRDIAPRPITFPADAAMHPTAGTEWWYLVGHLTGPAGHTYGFEVTFFKFSGLRHYFPASSVNTVFRTDVAITDQAARRFYHGITYVPSAPSRTIASTSELRLRAGTISMTTLGALRYQVRGALSHGGVALTVTSLRPPMLVHGGFQSWGSGYTYYYSLTDMRATGTLTVHGRCIPVHGIAWMDHQWGDMSASNVRGWAWMEMQLSDRTDLSLVNEHPASVRDSQWAMALLPDNRQRYVPRAIITPLGRWRSPHTGTVYPSGWHVRVPGLRLDVIVRPTVRDQEMVDNFPVRGYRTSYWEGSCTVTGTRAGHRVSGIGYTELTGYSSPPPAPSL